MANEKPQDLLNTDPNMGTDDDEELIDEAVETAEAEPPAEEKPEELLRVKTRSGKTYTGKTEREILDAMLADDAAAPEVREVRDKIDYQRDRRPAPTNGRKPFDGQKFLDMLGTDPKEALRYGLRDLFDLDDDEDPAEAFKYAYTVADRVTDSIEIAEFRRMTQANLTERDAAALLDEIDVSGQALTARNLAATYHDLVRQRRITPIQPEEPPAGATKVVYRDINAPPAAPSRGAGASRAPQAGGGQRQTTRRAGKDPEQMTDKELADSLREQGALID